MSAPYIHDHQYFQREITINEIPDEICEHNYTQYTQVQHISINMEYADDISYITSDYKNARRYERERKQRSC